MHVSVSATGVLPWHAHRATDTAPCSVHASAVPSSAPTYSVRSSCENARHVGVPPKRTCCRTSSTPTSRRVESSHRRTLPPSQVEANRPSLSENTQTPGFHSRNSTTTSPESHSPRASRYSQPVGLLEGRNQPGYDLVVVGGSQLLAVQGEYEPERPSKLRLGDALTALRRERDDAIAAAPRDEAPGRGCGDRNDPRRAATQDTHGRIRRRSGSWAAYTWGWRLLEREQNASE
jgi:hypothetical protein